jgi:hypothetical protein
MDIMEYWAMNQINRPAPTGTEMLADICAETHDRLKCGGETCKMCMYNVEPYVGVRQGRLMQIAADRHHNYEKLFIGTLLITLIIVILITVGTGIHTHYQGIYKTKTSYVAPASSKPAATAQTATSNYSSEKVWNVLKQIKKKDVDGDGEANCVDASIQFKWLYPEARLITNRGNPNGMNHMVVSVKDGNRTIYIEPQAYRVGGWDTFDTVIIWKGRYDPKYNIDETRTWMVYK